MLGVVYDRAESLKRGFRERFGGPKKSENRDVGWAKSR